jgi:hypothetical protein
MDDKGDIKKGFQGLFGNGKAKVEQPEAEPPVEAEEDVGPCAAIAKNRWITALTIRHAGKPWESYQFKDLDVRSEFEPTRFILGFSDAHERYRVVVTGRNLGRIYNLCIQGRLEWIRAADRDFGKDGDQIILKIETMAVEQKRG